MYYTSNILHSCISFVGFSKQLEPMSFPLRSHFFITVLAVDSIILSVSDSLIHVSCREFKCDSTVLSKYIVIFKILFTSFISGLLKTRKLKSPLLINLMCCFSSSNTRSISCATATSVCSFISVSISFFRSLSCC